MSDDIRALLRAGVEQHLYAPLDIGAIRLRARRRRVRGIAGMVVVAAVLAVPSLRFVDGLSNPTVRFAPATGTTADRVAREVPAGNVCARVLTASSGLDPLQRLGLQDRVPRALLAFGRMVPGSCIVDPSGERALAATVELVSDDGRLLATWVLLPLGQVHGVDGAQIAIADPGSVLHRPDPSRQYLDAESAFVIVEDSPVADDIAAIAVDAPQGHGPRLGTASRRGVIGVRRRSRTGAAGTAPRAGDCRLAARRGWSGAAVPRGGRLLGDRGCAQRRTGRGGRAGSGRTGRRQPLVRADVVGVAGPSSDAANLCDGR